MEILIAEDDLQIALSLKKNFEEEKNHSIIAEDGQKALELASQIRFDLVILDWRMPRLTGLEVCRHLREKGHKVPIILLTALSDISNKVDALNSGADDYVTKPFSFEELSARIKAVMRRYEKSSDVIECAHFDLVLSDHLLKNGSKSIKLSDKEFELLRYFITNRGFILSKDQIAENVWKIKFNLSTNIVEATIKNLRKKLEEISNRNLIRTVYGEGYVYTPD